ncbi:MAG TPA: PrsW family glutamic-type intramembrane protease, partial [Anaerolineales bacterium]|nr:PrsW family glutamic-type intramembrane protease [Anaerolineales bacterium]
LHMTSSGLVGWGIASAFKEKRWGRLAGAYLSAVLIHGVWNACAAGAGISAIGESLGKPEWVFNYTPAMICGLLVMGIGMVAVVLASNRKLRHSQIQPIIEEKVESPA